MSIQISDITNKSTIISDGAWGTELAKLGPSDGACSELWNSEHPDRVESVAKSYVDAGSQIILTNSFSGNRFRLKEYNCLDRLADLNKKAVEISKRAAGNKALVFASIGPSGKILSIGDVTEEELYDAFAEQAVALKQGGADGIVVETMSDAVELKAAIRAVKDKTGLFVVASLSFDSGADNTYTMMGVSVTDAVKVIEEAGGDVAGANCGIGIDKYKNICKIYKDSTDLPIWIKGNAGLPELVNNVPVYKMGPEEFAEHAREVVKIGANIIGGCCGSSPAHLKALADSLN
ncbi:MAG: homocysteine S-methyltransferase family protein [bacterium]